MTMHTLDDHDYTCAVCHRAHIDHDVARTFDDPAYTAWANRPDAVVIYRIDDDGGRQLWWSLDLRKSRSDWADFDRYTPYHDRYNPEQWAEATLHMFPHHSDMHILITPGPGRLHLTRSHLADTYLERNRP